MILSKSAREAGIPLAEVAAYSTIFPMPRRSDEGFDTSEMLQHITAVQPGTLKLDRRFLPGISELTTLAEIIEVPDHKKTREASKHFVAFGQMLLTSKDEGETALHVALKPLDDSVLAHEYGVTNLIASGEVPYCNTFRPIGVARMYDGQAAMLTMYRHPVRSMDNILLNPELIDEQEIVDRALDRVGVTLATAHAGDLLLVDSVARNMVWDPSTKHSGNVFLVDFEEAGTTHQMTMDEARTRRIGDLTTFIASSYGLEKVGCELPEDFDVRLTAVMGEAYESRFRQIAGNAGIVTATDIASIVAQSPRLP